MPEKIALTINFYMGTWQIIGKILIEYHVAATTSILIGTWQNLMFIWVLYSATGVTNLVQIESGEGCIYVMLQRKRNLHDF